MSIKKIKALISKNHLEFIFYLFVFLLPWQTLWIVRDVLIDGRVFEYGRLSLYGFDIVLIVLLILAGFNKYNQNTDKRRALSAESQKLKIESQISKVKCQRLKVKRQMLFIALLFIVYCWLSFFWSKEKLVAIYWGIRMLLGLGLFWLVAQKISFSKVRLAVVIVMTGAIQGLLAIWQFVQQGVWQSKWLGMDGQSARELGASVVEFGIERWLRAYGSLPHPNILGAWLVLSFVAVIYLIAKVEHKYHKLFLIFSAGFISLGILFSYSRAAWLGLVGVYLAGAVWLLGLKRERWLKNFAGWLLVYIAVLLAVFGSATWPLVKTRLNIGASNRLEVMSNTERIAGWWQAVEMWQKHRWLGVGLGNYSLVRWLEQPQQPVWQIQPAHNVWLLMWAELGLIGGLWGLIVAGMLLIYLIKRRQWERLGVMVLVFFLMMLDHFWWTLASGLYGWWLIAGWLAKDEV